MHEAERNKNYFSNLLLKKIFSWPLLCTNSKGFHQWTLPHSKAFCNVIRGLLPLRHLLGSIPSRQRLDITAANMKGACSGLEFRSQGTGVLAIKLAIAMNQKVQKLKEPLKKKKLLFNVGTSYGRSSRSQCSGYKWYMKAAQRTEVIRFKIYL